MVAAAAAACAVWLITGTAMSAAAGGTAPAATGCGTAAQYSSSATWAWADGPSLGSTTSADQWASADVSGLTDTDHNAGFVMRSGSTGIRVALAGDHWRIEPDGGQLLNGSYAAASSGTLRVDVAADNTVTIRYNGVVVTTAQVPGAFDGRGIVPTVWQSDTTVRLNNIQSNADAGCASPTASPTGGGTTSPGPMPYPAKAVAVYYMMWSDSPSPSLSDLPAGINVLNLAFAQGSPPQLVGWSPQGKSAFLAGISALRARGVRIVLSLGGEGGQIDVTDHTAFVQGVMAIDAEVPLDGIDWDLEGPAMPPADVVAVSTALKQQIGANFAITMAPNGSNVDDYIQVAQALNAAGALDMIGQQFYDAPVTVDQAAGRIQQMIDAGIPENKVGIGMMIADDANHWTLDQCVSNTQQLKAQYPDLRGGYLWEASRAGTSDWVSEVGALLLQ